MKHLAGILVSALLVAGGPANARPLAFKGGVLDGLRAELPDDGRPASAGYFVPGLARENPPSLARQAKIDGALKKARWQFEQTKSGGSPDLPGVRNEGESFNRFAGRLTVQCHIENSFQLPEAEWARVRVGVVCGDRLTQFFLFKFSDDEITDAEVVDAKVPNLGP